MVSTGQAQALKQQQTSPRSPSLRPNGSSGSLGHSLRDQPGGLRSLWAGWVLGAWLPQWWQLGGVWGPDPEGTAIWDLPPQLGLGSGERTQTGCWTNAPGQGNGRCRDPFLLARAWTSEGESWALGPCSFFSEQRITFVLVEVYRNMTWPWPDFTNKGSDTKKLATTNLIPSLTFPIKGLCWKLLGSSGFLRHAPPVSLHGPAINLSLLQTEMYWSCLASLCVGHMDLRSVIWGPRILQTYFCLVDSITLVLDHPDGNPLSWQFL